MESTNTFLIVSIAVGGAVFVGFVLFWFIGVYLKKRVGPGISAKATTASALRINGEEKRVQPHLSVSWNASFASPHGPGRAQLKDISLGGAFVVCPAPLPLSDRFQIVIELPDRTPLALNAEVVWSNANVPSDMIVNRGMGIRFIDNDASKRRLLTDAISALVAAPQPPAG
ncbi:MAG: PilZ domain-containing protein [Desulfobacterales bacterium]|nr:PilZ domain-containing protein [Desulfobacterales bacterium]